MNDAPCNNSQCELHERCYSYRMHRIQPNQPARDLSNGNGRCLYYNEI